MKKRLLWLPLVLLGAIAWLGGCSRDVGLPLTSELDEPNYRQGQQLGRQGREQEALAAFLKVIARRNDDAPESHLEAGLIYSQHIKDPISAIYHFRKYLELQPNSRQAELVRQRIDAAKRDFARTLPAQPDENGLDRLGLQEQLARLQRENEQLKADLAGQHGGIPVSAPPSRPRGVAVPEEEAPAVRTPTTINVSASDSPLTPVVRSSPLSPVRSPAAQPPAATKAGGTRVAPSKPAVGKQVITGRKYTVQVGDSLYKIAVRSYGAAGASAKANAIFEANRDVMKSDKDLRPGMELRIP
jgi:tetratricopeptide (TPR) repeat protein